MKQLAKYIVVFILYVFTVLVSTAQELPEILQQVLKADTAYEAISCSVKIQIDVPGLNMPEKDVELKVKRGKKPTIKSKGLIILPKHGIIGQYRNFLNQSCQAIPMGENKDTISYKVVSLDNNTDWVTVDLSITKSDARVQHLRIATRKNGEYNVKHYYDTELVIFPKQTEVQFEAMPLKLPLKFLGRQYEMESIGDKEGPVTGRVVLHYSDIEIKKER